MQQNTAAEIAVKQQAAKFLNDFKIFSDGLKYWKMPLIWILFTEKLKTSEDKLKNFKATKMTQSI